MNVDFVQFCLARTLTDMQGDATAFLLSLRKLVADRACYTVDKVWESSIA